MNYAYNLIEVKTKSNICFCPQLIGKRDCLEPYFTEKVRLSAAKFVRETDDLPFVRATMTRRHLIMHINEVDQEDLVEPSNQVVILSGQLEVLSPLPDPGAARIGDDSFADFERPTYVSIAFDVPRRVGVLFRASWLDGDREGVPIMFGEDLPLRPDARLNPDLSPDLALTEHLKRLGIPKPIWKSKGLAHNLQYLT